MKANSFLKQCIAEVIVEPTPQKLRPNQLIKECVLEVLRSNLTEQGYDPQSQAGPNPECENPYPRWNNKMRQLEEDGSQFELSNWKKRGQKVRVKFFNSGTGQNEVQDGVIREPQRTQAIIRLDKDQKTVTVPWNVVTPYMPNPQFGVNEVGPHGREAQMAGATPFTNDISEVNKNSSTEIKWECPHCHKPTMIQIEVESPSDYIACSDCEHCGKEINDPKLDAKVYDAVINHYAGRADYLKDMHTNEGFLAPKNDGFPTGWEDDKKKWLGNWGQDEKDKKNDTPPPPKKFTSKSKLKNEGGTWGEIEHDHKSDKPLPPKDDFPTRWN